MKARGNTRVSSKVQLSEDEPSEDSIFIDENNSAAEFMDRPAVGSFLNYGEVISLVLENDIFKADNLKKLFNNPEERNAAMAVIKQIQTSLQGVELTDLKEIVKLLKIAESNGIVSVKTDENNNTRGFDDIIEEAEEELAKLAVAQDTQSSDESSELSLGNTAKQSTKTVARPTSGSKPHTTTHHAKESEEHMPQKEDRSKTISQLMEFHKLLFDNTLQLQMNTGMLNGKKRTELQTVRDIIKDKFETLKSEVSKTKDDFLTTLANRNFSDPKTFKDLLMSENFKQNLSELDLKSLDKIQKISAECATSAQNKMEKLGHFPRSGKKELHHQLMEQTKSWKALESECLSIKNTLNNAPSK